jgi:hypothetical protein
MWENLLEVNKSKALWVEEKITENDNEEQERILWKNEHKNIKFPSDEYGCDSPKQKSRFHLDKPSEPPKALSMADFLKKNREPYTTPLSPHSTWNVIRDARRTNKFLDGKLYEKSNFLEKKKVELKDVEHAILQTDAKIDVYDKEIDECSIEISKLNEMKEKYENKSKKISGAIKTLVIEKNKNLTHLNNANDELKSCEHILQNQSIKLKTKNSEDNALTSKIDKLDSLLTKNTLSKDSIDLNK